MRRSDCRSHARAVTVLAIGLLSCFWPPASAKAQSIASRPQFEHAMRKVQARIVARAAANRKPASWPDGPGGVIAPLFPPDGYYGDSISQARQAELRNAIRDAINSVPLNEYHDNSNTSACNSFGTSFQNRLFLEIDSLNDSSFVSRIMSDCEKLATLYSGVVSVSERLVWGANADGDFLDPSSCVFLGQCQESICEFFPERCSNVSDEFESESASAPYVPAPGTNLTFYFYEEIRRGTIRKHCPATTSYSHTFECDTIVPRIDTRGSKAMSHEALLLVEGSESVRNQAGNYTSAVPSLPGIVWTNATACPLAGPDNAVVYSAINSLGFFPSGATQNLSRIGPPDITQAVKHDSACSEPATFDCGSIEFNPLYGPEPCNGAGALFGKLVLGNVVSLGRPDFEIRERASECASCQSSCSQFRVTSHTESADEILVVELGNRIDGQGGARLVQYLYPTDFDAVPAPKWNQPPIYLSSPGLPSPQNDIRNVSITSSPGTVTYRTALPNGNGVVDAHHVADSAAWTYRWYGSEQLVKPGFDPRDWTVAAGAIPHATIEVSVRADGTFQIQDYDETGAALSSLSSQRNGNTFTKVKSRDLSLNQEVSISQQIETYAGGARVLVDSVADSSVISRKSIYQQSLIAGRWRTTRLDAFVDQSADPQVHDDRLLRTEWVYYGSTQEPGAANGKIKLEKRPDGGWTRWFYDGSGMTTKTIRGFQDNEYSESNLSQLEAQNVVTAYEVLAVSSLSRGLAPAWWGIPGSAAQVPVTNVVRVTTFYPRDNSGVAVSEPVSCSYEFEIVDSAQNPSVRSTRWSIRCADPSQPIASNTTAIATFLGQCLRGVVGSVDTGVPYNGANLVRVTELAIDGNGNWFTSRELGSEGTLTVTQVTGSTTKVWQGFPITSTSTPTAFLADFLHHTLSAETHDAIGLGTSVQYDSGPSGTISATTDDILVQSRVESSPDVLRRPQRVDYLDGTYETKSYACCGVASETDRDGVLTFYTYDALGRVASSSTKLPQGTDLITTYDYDAEGRVIRTRRSSSVTAEPTVTIEETEYDLAGRVKATTQNGVRTVTSYAKLWSSGSLPRIIGTEQTVTSPSFFNFAQMAVVPTEKSTAYSDGRTKKAESPSGATLFSYAVKPVVPASGGAAVPRMTTRTIRGSDPAGTEWAESAVDGLGRLDVLAYSDGAKEKRYYGPRSQLIKSEDADGVRTLFEGGWDDTLKVEYRVSAVDMDPTPTNGTDDRNGLIDLAGSDRVRRSESAVLATGSLSNNTQVPWRRTTEKELTTVSNATAWVELSRTDEYLKAGKRESRIGPSGSTLIAVSETSRNAPLAKRNETVTGPNLVTSVSEYRQGVLVSEATRKPSETNDWLKRTFTYDNHGRMLTITDLDPTGGVNHPTTTYAFVPFPSGTQPASDRVASITQSPVTGSTGSQTMSFEYDELGRQNVVYLPDSTGSSPKKVTSYFDAAGRVTHVRGDRTYPVDYSYDALGRMETLTTYKSATKNTNGSWTVGSPAITKWEYDTQRGWLKKKWYADASSGNPTTAGSEYTYTPAGRLATRKWVRGSITSYAYNEAGDLKGRTYNDTITPPVTLSYDRRGRMIGVVDVAGTRALTYDTFDRVTDEMFTAGTFNEFRSNQTYATDKGYRTTLGYRRVSGGTTYELSNRGFGYDAMWRPDRFWILDKPNGSNWFARFDAKYSYELVGNRPLSHTLRILGGTSIGTSASAVPSDTGATSLADGVRAYDGLGRLSVLQWGSYAGPSNGTFVESYGYTYNSANQRTKQTVSRGGDRPDYDWDFTYDQFGQLTGAAKKWTQVSPPQVALGQDLGYAYDAIGNRTQTTLSDTAGNYATSNYNSNRLNQYTDRSVPRVFDFMGYSALNPAYVQMPGETSPGVAAARQPTYPSATGPYFRRKVANFSNDAAGDFATGAQAIPYFVPATPEVYTYDADGNLTSDGRCTYTWNGENQLVQVDLKSGLENLPSVAFEGTWVYEYDYIGRRVRKYRRTLQLENMMMSQGAPEGQMEGPQTQSNFGEGGEQGLITDETKFFYDGWLLTLEVSGYAAIRSYYYGLDLSGSTSGAAGIGGLLFQLNGAATPGPTNTRWFCHDPQGNVTSLRSVSDNTRIASLETGPYGDQAIADGLADELKLRFSGKYRDGETGLAYFGHRYYSIQLGKWINNDPVGVSGGANLTAFVTNVPNHYLDPLGLAPQIWTGSGINNWDRGKFRDYVSTEMGVKPERSFISKAGTTRDYMRGWIYDGAAAQAGGFDIARFFGWHSKLLLNLEAWHMARQLPRALFKRTDGCRPTKVKVLLVAPKTHTQATWDKSICDVQVDLYYSVRDKARGAINGGYFLEPAGPPRELLDAGVPNQGMGGEESHGHWQWIANGGSVHAIDSFFTKGFERRGSNPDHSLQAFISTDGTLRDASPFFGTSGDPPDIMAAKDRMLSSDADYVFIGHSQGANIMLHVLRQVCNK